jgi:hypothetical protein
MLNEMLIEGQVENYVMIININKVSLMSIGGVTVNVILVD